MIYSELSKGCNFLVKEDLNAMKDTRESSIMVKQDEEWVVF